MPKRQKPKVKTTTKDRGPSAAKLKRINTQLGNEEENKAAKAMGTLTPWQLVKQTRKAHRSLERFNQQAYKTNGKNKVPQ